MGWFRRKTNANQQKQRKHPPFSPFLCFPFISSKPKPPNPYSENPQFPKSNHSDHPQFLEANLSHSNLSIEASHGSDEIVSLDHDHDDHPKFEDEFSTDMTWFPVKIKSRDPFNDFKESIEEMIRANRIQRQEELERLLEIFLLANDEEHEDLILRAFQKVVFEMSFERFY